MRKLVSILLVCTLAISFVVGVMVSSAGADGGIGPCKIACIEGDTYICCWVNGYWTCGFVQEGCDPP